MIARDALNPDLAAAGAHGRRDPVPGPTRRSRDGRSQPGAVGRRDQLLARFNSGTPGLQFVTDRVWISSLGIHYKLGINGLNVVLVLLTTVLFSVSLWWSAMRDVERPHLYYFRFGLAESAVLGAFCAQDLILFVAFFDLMLIPFYFLVGSWGTGERVRATIKMVIYTMVGLVPDARRGDRDRRDRASQHHAPLNFTFSALAQHAALARPRGLDLPRFALAFLVKMPIAPFHGWLADAYKSMPIPAVAVFSGVLSKVASYGFLQIVLPLFPHASHHYQLLMLIIALVSILWATAMAFTTRDARLVIAYSSVAQMGFILLGIFSLTAKGGQGALLQMLNHGVVTAASFFVVAAVAARARRQREPRRHGRHRVQGAGARDALPDRHASRTWRCRAPQTSSASS